MFKKIVLVYLMFVMNFYFKKSYTKQINTDCVLQSRSNDVDYLPKKIY